MIILPSRSSLFPYTTLFRSQSRDSRTAGSGRCSPSASQATNEELETLNEELQATVEELNTDRKSTRLNSSHLVISYAVFCLKKKILETLDYDIKHMNYDQYQ